MAVPCQHRVAGKGRADMCTSRVRRGIARIAWDQRAGEAPAAVLRPVVTQPDHTEPDERPVRREDAAVVVGATDDDVRVARIDPDSRLVLPSLALRARSQHIVRVRRPRHERVVADVRRVVVAQASVRGPRLCRRNGDCAQKCEGGREKPPSSSHLLPSPWTLRTGKYRFRGRPVYLTSESILNIGRDIAITMTPTMQPTMIIISGSTMDVSELIAE